MLIEISLKPFLPCWHPHHKEKTDIFISVDTYISVSIKNRLMKIIFRALTAFFILLNSTYSYGSHILGGDISYQCKTRYTYTLNLTVYTDCAGPAEAVMTTSHAKVNVYNDTSLYNSYSIALDSDAEISPLCALYLDSTTCNAGRLPGIRAYYYHTDIALPTTSSKWKFDYIGDLTSTTGALVTGISNLTGAQVSELVATLDNTADSFSTPVFLSRPLFFATVNQAVNYNSVAADPNNDSLNTRLTAALSIFSNVVYNSGYSPTQPVSASSFAFDSLSGELSITPNIIQKSVITEQVRKYRHNKMVGTNMREWVLTTAAATSMSINNLGARIDKVATGVTKTDSVSVQSLKSNDSVNYSIICSNPRGNNITISAADLPIGASFSVVNNGTATPEGIFKWNTTTIPPGIYSFLLNLSDNGCPFTATAIIPFKIIIRNNTAVENVLSEANSLAIYPNPAGSNIKLSFRQLPTTPMHINIISVDGRVVKHFVNITAVSTIDISDLPHGIYCLIAQNENRNELIKSSFVKE